MLVLLYKLDIKMKNTNHEIYQKGELSKYTEFILEKE